MRPARFPSNPKEHQLIIDQFYKWVYDYKPPAPKIVCRTCGRGPIHGIAVRKVGWIWVCDNHAKRRKF